MQAASPLRKHVCARRRWQVCTSVRRTDCGPALGMPEAAPGRLHVFVFFFIIIFFLVAAVEPAAAMLVCAARGFRLDFQASFNSAIV